MDEEGQLVVRIESIESNEVDQTLLDSLEPSREEDSIDSVALEAGDSPSMSVFFTILRYSAYITICIWTWDEVHYVRPLPEGGFEIVAEEEAASFLEIVEDNDRVHVHSGDLGANFEDSAQIIITQDADGHLMVEGTPLQFLLESNNQQQLQFLIDKKK